MNAKDIKLQTWITYQGADNSVWARIKQTITKERLSPTTVSIRIDKEYLGFNFPILNTTEINLEIQGEDLELVWQWQDDILNDWVVTETPNIDDYQGFNTRQALRYTPKQTPKADSDDYLCIKNFTGLSAKKYIKGQTYKSANIHIFHQSNFKEFFEPTPLSKVDNHIGVQEAAYQYALLSQGMGSTEEDFIAGATYRTQHPDPEMVDRILEYVAENAKGVGIINGAAIIHDVDRDAILAMKPNILKIISNENRN